MRRRDTHGNKHKTEQTFFRAARGRLILNPGIVAACQERQAAKLLRQFTQLHSVGLAASFGGEVANSNDCKYSVIAGHLFSFFHRSTCSVIRGHWNRFVMIFQPASTKALMIGDSFGTPSDTKNFTTVLSLGG